LPEQANPKLLRNLRYHPCECQVKFREDFEPTV
jgi:hypothetical protein